MIQIIEGVPHLHGKPAVYHRGIPLLDCFSNWRCPFCKAELMVKTYTCLNACHLEPDTKKKFHLSFTRGREDWRQIFRVSLRLMDNRDANKIVLKMEKAAHAIS